MGKHKQKSWVGKKAPTNPKKKEQHQNRKTKDELEHRWQNDDWSQQVKDFLEYASKPFQE